MAVLIVLLAGGVDAAGSAFADSTTDQVLWQRCLAESSGSVWFDATEVNWLDPVVLHYSATIGADCGNLTQTTLVEDTPQSNDNPSTVSLGFGGGWTAAGAVTVTPLRNLPWSLRVSSVLGFVDLRPADPHDHRNTAGIMVNYPVPPLAGSPSSFTVTDNSVAQRREFVQAVQTPGTTVTVAGNVNLDLSGLNDIAVAPGVQILGDRSVNPLGPLLFTTTEPRTLFHVGRPVDTNPPFSHERISGIRLRGGSSTDPFANMGDEDSDGITVQKPNVEIDHNEIFLWRGAGVEVKECESNDACPTPDILPRPTPGNTASTVWIHDNYIHHDQHPAGDICCGHAEGYGVETSHGGYALIEQNVFDYNRHSVASGYQPGTGYLFYRNLILTNGGVHSRVSATHAIDVHGADGPSYESGKAGEYFDVEYNTVWYTSGHAVKLRGTPSDKMEVRHNVFAGCAVPTNTCFAPALVQNETGMVTSDNVTGYGIVAEDARTSCDFDGDGVNDTFHATGITWWYQSSRLGGRYIYLNQSTAAGSAITLGDVNGDGLCDVTASNSVFLNPGNGVEVAVRGSDGQLRSLTPRGDIATGARLAPGSSPAVTALGARGTQTVFVSPDGLLWRAFPESSSFPVMVGSNTLSVAHGTSPAIASDGHGNWKVAFQAPDHHLWTLDSSGGARDTGAVMAAGSSPSLAYLPSAGGYEITYAGSDNMLWRAFPDTNWFHVVAGSFTLSVSPGTSPVIATDGNAGWKIAFQAPDHHLWTVDGGIRDTGAVMAAGSSPSLAFLPGYGYEIAFAGSDNLLWRAYPDTNWFHVTAGGFPLSVSAGTSPVIATGTNVWTIAFQAPDHHLWTADASGGARDTGTVMAAGTNPALSGSAF